MRKFGFMHTYAKLTSENQSVSAQTLFTQLEPKINNQDVFYNPWNMHIIPHYFKNCRLYRISELRPQTLPREWEDSASMSSKKIWFWHWGTIRQVRPAGRGWVASSNHLFAQGNPLKHKKIDKHKFSRINIPLHILYLLNHTKIRD